MNRRNFLTTVLASAVAPMLWTPKLIKPSWQRIQTIYIPTYVDLMTFTSPYQRIDRSWEAVGFEKITGRFSNPTLIEQSTWRQCYKYHDNDKIVEGSIHVANKDFATEMAIAKELNSNGKSTFLPWFYFGREESSLIGGTVEEKFLFHHSQENWQKVKACISRRTFRTHEEIIIDTSKL